MVEVVASSSVALIPNRTIRSQRYGRAKADARSSERCPSLPIRK
jgi:hypothetical protein